MTRQTFYGMKRLAYGLMKHRTIANPRDPSIGIGGIPKSRKKLFHAIEENLSVMEQCDERRNLRQKAEA